MGNSDERAPREVTVLGQVVEVGPVRLGEVRHDPAGKILKRRLRDQLQR